MTNLLDIHHLTLRFRGESKAAVNSVSLTVAAGETVALVGESGSGKTMTALSIARLAPEETLDETSGQILLEGIDMLAASPTHLRSLRRGRIGVVFQDPAASLNPIMTVGRQVREALTDPTRLDALLEEVGLGSVPNAAGRYPHELSGGQQQRIGIAMALAGDPVLLIADEPTTALDVTIQTQILSLLSEIKSRRGMAMLFISHDFGVVAQLADRIYVMRAGEIVETGTTNHLLAKPATAYTSALIACRPSLDTHPARLATLDGTPAALPRPAVGDVCLALEGLCVRYPPSGLFGTAVDAVSDVSLTLGRGEAVGLVGESGSGKSSVARAVVGLAPIHSGTIQLVGSTFTPARATHADRRTVQYVFQDSYGSLNPRHSVQTLVREGLDLHGMGAPSDRDARVRGLLHEVGLSDTYLTRFPRELSGGQRQRVAIARALALEPQILICDEIVSALDVSVQAQILNLLKDLMAQRSLAVLFISHDLGAVRFLADRIAVMADGRLVETATAADLVASPRSEQARALIAASRAIELSPLNPTTGSSARKDRETLADDIML